VDIRISLGVFRICCFSIHFLGCQYERALSTCRELESPFAILIFLLPIQRFDLTHFFILLTSSFSSKLITTFEYSSQSLNLHFMVIHLFSSRVTYSASMFPLYICNLPPGLGSDTAGHCENYMMVLIKIWWIECKYVHRIRDCIIYNFCRD